MQADPRIGRISINETDLRPWTAPASPPAPAGAERSATARNTAARRPMHVRSTNKAAVGMITRIIRRLTLQAATTLTLQPRLLRAHQLL